MKIQVRGGWGAFWLAWHVAWLALIVWGARVAYELQRAGLLYDWTDGFDLAIRWLYTAFLAPELIGSVLNWRDPPGTPEQVRTLSQFRQRIAQEGRGPAMLGWKALALGSGAIDACFMTMIVAPISPWLAVVMGFTLFLWLAPHYGLRWFVG